MLLEEAIAMFGSGRQVCLNLGISDRNFTKWRRRGWIPQVQQLRLEKLTNGKLRADEFGSNRRPLSKN